MSEKRDVAVVGGGPIGCFTAEGLARKGYDVDIIEEHWDIGWPMQCAGLLSTRIFDVIGHGGAKRSIQNKVKGARVYSPSGKHIDVMANKTKAYVVDRNILDKELACSAIKCGARLRIGAKAVASKRTQSGVKLRVMEGTSQSTLESRLLIGADGPQSQVARWFSLKPRPWSSPGSRQSSPTSASLRTVSASSSRSALPLGSLPGRYRWTKRPPGSGLPPMTPR